MASPPDASGPAAQALAPAAPAGRVAAGELAARLLAWYDANRRRLPWRAAPGERPDPYRVWLSEVMLQQTTVAAVEPYFRRFVTRWPDVESLARAGLDEVLHAWQGLGYYARARNLHRCAGVVSRELGGRFPDTEEGLMRLPGIGPYTAAAIAAIAFSRPVAVVDGNVERVLARLFALRQPLPAAKGRIRGLARGLTPALRPGDYAQAVMDLGAMVCTPRGPDCPRCPWAGACAARALGLAEELPRRAPRRARPTRRAVAFWLVRGDGAVWLRRRAESGLLGGMMEVPSTEWRERAWTAEEARAAAPALPLAGPAVRWLSLPGVVRHSFTHFHLEVAVLAGRIPAPGPGPRAASPRGRKPDRGRAGKGATEDGAGTGGAGGGETAPDPEGVWVRPERLGELALPAVMKKIIRHALAAA